MVDDADHEEERSFEKGVRDEHRDAGEGGRTGSGAQEGDEETELADGAVGQDELEVDLA